jgi:DNA adenine methylase
MNSNKKVCFPKPILKWVGGKTQIIDKVVIEFPRIINNYHEIFLGGGSVLFALLSSVNDGSIKINGTINAYDLNEPLIYVYKNIQTNHNELYVKLQEIITEYRECIGKEVNRKANTLAEAKQSKENYYYWIRCQYNNLTRAEKTTCIGSALFIFLNKTCFRGIFRVGPNGFNVPYGHYANPEIMNREHLEEIHILIQGVVFETCDYSSSLTRVEDNDFVYFDPPYAPEIKTSFVGYTENGFCQEQHIQLFSLCNKLSRENKKFMMNNSDVPLVREHFPTENYNLTPILCKRAIHSKKPDSKAKELIIKNY